MSGYPGEEMRGPGMMFNARRFLGVKVFKVFLVFWAAAVLLAAFGLPACAADLHERAKNLYDVGDYNAALSLYERILRNDPGDGLAWDISAWCHRFLGDAKSSEENYKKALALLKGEDALWSFIGFGELYMTTGRYKDALDKLYEAKNLAAGNGEAMERTLRDIEFAEKALTEALVSEPLSGDTEANQAEMTNAEERLGKALLEEPPSQPPAEENPAPAAKPDDKAQAEGQGERPVKPAKPKPAPKKPEPEQVRRPPRNDVGYGVTLGSPIAEALEALKKRGGSVLGEPFTKDGKEFYAAAGLDAALPDTITGGAERERFYIVSYGGAVFSVNAEFDYGRDATFAALIDTARGAIGEISGLGGTRGLSQISNIFSFEMHLAVSNTYGVSMMVVDKGDGTSRMEIRHIDLYGLSDYLSGKRRGTSSDL
jgi:tetratricopeptide (TPR) repeat protein